MKLTKLFVELFYDKLYEHLFSSVNAQWGEHAHSTTCMSQYHI